MRIYIISFLLLLFLHSCMAWYIAKKSSWIKKSTPLVEEYFDSIKIDIIRGLPIGEVTIAGEKRKFLFDTGAYTVIDEHDVDREGVKTYPKPDYDVRDKNDSFYQLLEKRKMYRSDFVNLIDTLAINNTTFGNVGAATVRFKTANYISECYDELGILGYNVMNDGVWSFDYANKSIVFANSVDHFNLNNTQAFDIDFVHNFPVIKIAIKDTVLRVGIDTGNNSLVISTNDDVIEKYSIKSADITQANIGNFNISQFVTKGFSKKEAKYLELVTNFLGFPYHFNVLTNMKGTNENMSNDFDMVIGHDFIKDFVITIDYINKKAYFKPNKPIEEFDNALEEKSISLGLSKYDNRAYITSFLPQFIDSTKVDIGDPLLAVNQIPIDSIINQDNYCEFIKGLHRNYFDLDTNILTIKNKKGEIHNFKSFKVILFD